MLLTLLTVNDIINYYNSRSHCVFDEHCQTQTTSGFWYYVVLFRSLSKVLRFT